MVGFGRAVGETMIVLMATGNTPIMDASPFNGFRTLSANIAVEISEAPAGGTLYRTLFLAALLALRAHLRRQHRRRAGAPAPPAQVFLALGSSMLERKRPSDFPGRAMTWLTGGTLALNLLLVAGLLAVL